MRGSGREKTDAPVRSAYDRPMLIRLTCGPSAERTWRVTLQREELCVAVTGLSLTLDEIEFADMVVVAESAEDQAAIAESVFAARGLQQAPANRGRLEISAADIHD